MPQAGTVRKLTCAVLALLCACRTSTDIVAPTTPPMLTDAAQYVVKTIDDVYVTTITYEFQNTTGVVLSSTRCGLPPAPVLEKHVGGQWVLAYAPIELACLSIPHFYIAPDAVFRRTLEIIAGKPGTNFGPQFSVESIPGTYRLRWGLKVGPDPESPTAPAIRPVSNEFQLILD